MKTIVLSNCINKCCLLGSYFHHHSVTKNSSLVQFSLNCFDCNVQQKFYMIGWDKSGTIWRVLSLDRQEPSELNMQEDPTIYMKNECEDLLKRIDDGNRSSGGLRFVTQCYGIVGRFPPSFSQFKMIIFTISCSSCTTTSVNCYYGRFCEVFGALLLVANYKKEKNWFHMWPHYLCHL